MWYAAVLRCLRRRFVLALIFCLSLTYCLINLLGTVSENEVIIVLSGIETISFRFIQGRTIIKGR